MNTLPLELRRIQMLPLPRQADALLENPAALQAFPAEELYGLVCSLGLEDAIELVQCTSPSQFCTLVDLAAWRGGSFQEASLLAWLEAAHGEDEEAFFAKIQNLDMEILELLFRRAVQIKQVEEEAEDTSLEAMETVDARWRLEFLVKGGAQHVVRRMCETWMGKNALEFSRFLEAVRWSLPSESEETAFRFRNARLEDMGFPPREHAVSLFAWVDARQYCLAPRESALVEAGETLLEEGFRMLPEEQRQQLEAEARYLVNNFLIAEGADAGDMEAIYDLSRQARDYLNLGLQHMTLGQRTLLAKALQEFGLKKIFQVGFSLTLDLKRAIERMRKEPHAQWQNAWWTMDALASLLSALGARRPCMWKEGQKAMLKTLADIAFAKAQLEKARRQMRVMAALHQGEPHKALLPFGAELGVLRAERFFCAALAHFVVEGKPRAKPFAAGATEALEAKLCASPFPEVADSFARALLSKEAAPEEALFEEAQEMAGTCLQMLRAQLDASKAKRGDFFPEDILCLPMEGLALRHA